MSAPTRATLVSITLTARGWDALLGERYAEGARSRSLEQVRDAVGPAGERHAAAKAEAEARVPKLSRDGKQQIAAHTREALELLERGKLDVDHLGSGESWPRYVDGFSVTIIPSTHPIGLPALHFRVAQVWFAGKQLPMRDEDREWLLRLAKRHGMTDCWGGIHFISARRLGSPS